MKNLNHIQATISAHTRAARQLLAEKGDRAWSAADQAAFDQRMDEVDRLQSQLDAAPTWALGPQVLRAQYREGVDLYLRNGMRNLTPDQRRQVQNTMSTTTGSEGGFAVPSLVAQDLVSLLKGYGFMRLVAKQMTTQSGAAMGAATSDGTTETGEMLTENTQAASLDMSFGTRNLNAYKFGSKVFSLPIELIQDSQVDIVSEVFLRGRERIGRIQNTKFTVGSGSGEPVGLVTAASVGKVGTTGQTTTVIYDDLVDLIDSLDDAHFGMPSAGARTAVSMPGWMMSQSMRKVVRKVKDTAGRPIWTPTYNDGATTDATGQTGATGTLLDYPVYLNNAMAAPAASAKSLAFGNLASYCIRDVMEVGLWRMEDSAFMTKGQVGFLAWARAGGNLLDVGAVKLYQHPAT